MLTPEQKQRILASPNFQSLINKPKVEPATVTAKPGTSFVERARLAREPIEAKQPEVTPEEESTILKLIDRFGGKESLFGKIGEFTRKGVEETVQTAAGLGVSGVNLAKDVGALVGGERTPEGQIKITPRTRNIEEANLPLVGKVKPFFTGEEKLPEFAGKVATGGLEVASILPTGKAIKESKVALETAFDTAKGGIKRATGLARGTADVAREVKQAAEGIPGIVKRDILGTAKDIPAEKITAVARKQSENLNKIFDESTNKIRKQANFLGEQDINIGEELTKRKIDPLVANDRLKFKDEDIASIRKAISDDSKVLDEAIAIYKNADISPDYLKEQVSKLVKSNKEVVSQGRVDELTKKAYNKIDEFLQQNEGKDFTLSQINDFKKGMYGLSKKFKTTSVADSDAFSELGRIFKQIVEDEVPDVAIKNLNKEIGKNLSLVDFLENVKAGGGIVLKGGKLGKHFEEVAGRTVGAGIGLVTGGPVGAVAGGFLGGEVASLIRTFSQKASILSYAERNIIKMLEKLPTNADLLAAKKFLEDVKKGLKPTLSERAKNILNTVIKDKVPTTLPKNIKK